MPRIGVGAGRLNPPGLDSRTHPMLTASMAGAPVAAIERAWQWTPAAEGFDTIGSVVPTAIGGQ